MKCAVYFFSNAASLIGICVFRVALDWRSESGSEGVRGCGGREGCGKNESEEYQAFERSIMVFCIG